MSSIVKRLIAVQKLMRSHVHPKSIDGWFPIRLNEQGQVMAGKYGKEPGDFFDKDLVGFFKPEGKWAIMAEYLKLAAEFRYLFGSLTDEEVQQFRKYRESMPSLDGKLEDLEALCN